ncbi:MAG: hypothetical protein PHI91_03325 [Candidatus Pacebacteria bacterium]|nr:hypothetical protein [Candidatus Paceibacterota bacterium]MDD3970191.1 hypothetical protein [Candidatus Paceibacterota bacterium]
MIPKQCILWKKEKLTADDLSLDNFEVIKSLPSLSHISESLIKCKECGQLYIFEDNDFFADPFADDLPVYMTYVPVSMEELIDHLKVEKTLYSIFEINAPRIFYDIRVEGKTIGWNGKNNL